MTATKTDDLFNEANEAAASAWFKRDKVGDSCKGTLVGSFIKPAKGLYKEQKVYELQQEDGSVLNLPAFTPYMEKILKRVKIGQIVGAKYTGDYHTDAMKKEGLNAAKTVTVYLGDMDESYDLLADLGKEVAPDDIANDVGNVEFK